MHDTWYKVRIRYEYINSKTIRLSYWIDGRFAGRHQFPSNSYEADLGVLALAAGEGSAWFDDTRVAPVSAQGGVLGILPNRGGNAGNVTATISTTGLNLSEISDVRLVKTGESDIIGTRISVTGEDIVATFNLLGQSMGSRDVLVVTATGERFQLPNAFTVETGGVAVTWIEVLGPTQVRAGRKQKFTVVYGNRGNVDAENVPLVIQGIPAEATWSLDDLEQPPEVPDVLVDWTAVPTSLEHSGLLSIPLLLQTIPADTTGVLTLSVTPSASQSPMELRAAIGSSLFDPNARGEDCFMALFRLVINTLNLSPEEKCLRSAVGYLSSLSTIASNRLRYYSLVQAAVASISITLNCSGVVIPQARVIGAVVSAAGNTLGFLRVIDKCIPALLKAGEVVAHVFIVNSVDPNEKIGPRGAGQQQFLAAGQPLAYAVHFENLETATAPAQEVVVVDHLDTNRFDLNTLTLGPISFGQYRVIPPRGSSDFKTMLDLRPSHSLLVSIEVSADKASGLLKWTLTSIDPATGEPPTDPLVGFLPPNKKPPEGTGSVLFSAKPLFNLQDSSLLTNKASITFDTNLPIETASWGNIIDATPPVSSVSPLAPTQNMSSFEVQWTGSDSGAGIESYSVYVSKDGGPSTPWLLQTDRSSAIFTGYPGSSYAFRSLARDRVGNVEAAHVSADASTTVAIAANPCSPGAKNLCLSKSRFRVEVTWRDFEGNAGFGQVISVNSDDSGIFWFFNSANWEMLVKVLNGCVLNHRFWVFAAATTTVEYTLRVTDTSTGVVREYFNPLGSPAIPIIDTDAFETCP